MNETAFVLALVALWLVFVRRHRAQRLPLPPGPIPWPIIGNVLDMPSIRPWEKYREWCKTYNSNIVYLDLAMQPTLIVGSAKAAIDLLDKRSNLYSDRIRVVMFELMSWDFNIALMPYTAKWRAHRRTFHQHFYQGVVSKYQPIQLQYVRMFLLDILRTPLHTRKHVRQVTTSIIFFITYGKRVTGMDDEAVTTSQLAVEGANAAGVPGRFWIEFLPFLKNVPSWVPGTSSKRFAEKFLPYVIKMRDKTYNDVKAAFEKGVAPPSLATTLIARNSEKYSGTEDEPFYDDVARNVAGVAYAAGADTTTSACESFLTAMAMFPTVQKKAQEELDRIVGLHRLPEFDDFEKMPYVRAIVMEVMRWVPVLPFGIPHALTTDDVYDGYHIPKGTAVIPNAWAMLHDPEDYPEPELFKPERFIGKDGRIDVNVRDPSTIAFGFGRRMCPGRHFSNNTLSILIASTLHVFDVTAGVDASGKLVELNPEMIGGTITVPRDVPCGLKPRSESAAALITKYASETLAELASTPSLT